MKSERQKVLAGELYDPMDPTLVADRQRARDLCPGPEHHPRGGAGGAPALRELVTVIVGSGVYVRLAFLCGFQYLSRT